MMAAETADFAGHYRVTGMDCPSCATKIESAARKVAGVLDVKVSTASQHMSVRVVQPQSLQEMEKAVTALGYELLPISDGDEAAPAHLKPAYKRALLIVVALNLGYGFVEMVGGFLANSQALKADALDFVGDGLITLLGVWAIRWQRQWRARSALLQGLFLGILGLGVFGSTIHRFVTARIPEPELMGVLGLIALAVNVGAAFVLVPHRQGDSNVKAVWLFSRNDAIGNFAVVIAAGLVAWLKSPWPDLVVAMVISGLFLQSALTILRDAHRELRPISTSDQT